MSLTSKVTNQDPLIYYELTVFNNDTTGLSPLPQISFDETRNIPFLKNSSQYLGSIVSFQIETNSLPVVAVQPVLNQSNINKLIYEVTYAYMGHQFTGSIIYTGSGDPSVLTPTSPIDSLSDIASPYYYMYSYQDFIRMINLNLATIYNDFLVYLDSLSVARPTLVPPYFYFDTKTSLITLYCETAFFNSYITNPISIIFNRPLYNLFDTIPAYEETGKGLVFDVYLTGKNESSVKYPYYDNNAYGSIGMEQETTSISAMNPIQEILVTSASFPVLSTLFSKPAIFGTGQNLVTNGGNNLNQQPVLSTFRVAVSNGNTYKNVIVYSPQAQYRYLTLNGGTPLHSIHLEAFWRDRFGNFVPIYLDAGRSASLLLLFKLIFFLFCIYI